jgi:hypothetical protein
MHQSSRGFRTKVVVEIFDNRDIAHGLCTGRTKVVVVNLKALPVVVGNRLESAF